MNGIDTLIISDVHCGLGAARVEAAMSLLAERNFKRLILLGDILHTTNLRRMKARDFSFLKVLRELGDPKSGIEVVWVVGNHDLKLASTPAFLGIPVCREYEWNENGLRHLAFHGDALYNITKESGIFGFFYLAAEWIFLFAGSRRAARLFKNTFAMRIPSEKLKERALAYAKEKGIPRVFCGHIHIELSAAKDGVTYWNSGTWLDEPSPYITITNGNVEIRYA